MRAVPERKQRMQTVRVGRCGEVAERSMAADCKSAGATLRWFKSNPLHQPSLLRSFGWQASWNKSTQYVYIIQSVQDTTCWYTGQTDDLKARLHAHNAGPQCRTVKAHGKASAMETSLVCCI
jgi:hypothetical protein